VIKNQIVLYNGLAQYLDSEDEFAAVLAHEMGHDIAGHYEKALINQGVGAVVAGAIFASVATAAGYDSYQAQSDTQTAMQLGAALGSISFSKEHEREADYIAAYLMTRAGYNPDAASTIWIKITKAGGRMKTGLFDTHPSGPDRLAAWEETVNEVRFSKDLMPNLAGAEEEPRLQVARVFDGSAINSLPENSAVALAMQTYKPELGTSGAVLGGSAQALLGQGGKASSNSSWVAQGPYDSCGAEWVLKVERKGAVLRGNMWWKDAKYDVYGNIDYKGRTTDARAGKNKASQTIPAPRFFRIEIAFEPNSARGSFAIDSTSGSCQADFTLARVSS
jgi:predicted Zn-dependent protease